MNNLKYLFIGLTLIVQSSYGQTTTPKVVYNKHFKWTITIPESFQNVSAAESAEMQNRGIEAIENTYDGEVIDQSKTIFLFNSDQLNYFEANYQPFDIATDGDYLESCKSVNNIIYETFRTQMPDIKIDTTTSTEMIDNLKFQTLKINIEYPNKMTMTMLMYSRLFDKKELSVNIMYVDESKGQLMLDAWKASKFAK